jgi:hypothetical protein
MHTQPGVFSVTVNLADQHYPHVLMPNQWVSCIVPFSIPLYRWGPGQPLEQFVPTRGLIYSVFAELDHEDKGKLTYSEFEDAAVIVGLRQDQARVFYNM